MVHVPQNNVTETSRQNRLQSSCSHQGDSSIKERSPAHCYLPGSSAHVTPGKLTHTPLRYHWWHLNVRLSNKLKCVPYFSQLSLVLSLCPDDPEPLRMSPTGLQRRIEEDDIWETAKDASLESASSPFYTAKHTEQGFKLHLTVLLPTSTSQTNLETH